MSVYRLTKRRFTGLIMLMGIISAAWTYAHRSGPKKFSFVFDYAIASEIREPIKDLLQKPLRAHEILGLLRETYPFIDRVTISYKHPDRAIITIRAQQPYALIDEKLLITTQGTLVQRANYNPSAYESCLVCMTEQQRIDSATTSMIGTFLKKLPAEILENYICHWHDQTQIMLQNIHSPLQLIAESQTIFNEKLLESLHQLIEQKIMPEQAKKRRGDSYWTIDVRCKNYLILASHKGDMGHEKIKRDA